MRLGPISRQDTGGGSPSSRRRWRRLAIIAGIVAVVIGLGAALVLVAPRYVARLVADRYFQGVGVDVEGVKTFDIDLPKGEMALGPVRFQSGDAAPGEVGLFGIKLSLRNLFDRQALLQQVLIKDVDVAINQAPDGEISINGVPLRQFLAKKDADQPPPETPEGKPGSPWGAGIDDLALRNLRIAFTGPTGGTAALTIEHLDIEGFRTWEPNQPGTFVMTGEVNGIDMTATGNARPFGDKITVNAEKSLRQRRDRQDRDLHRAAGPDVAARRSHRLRPQRRLDLSRRPHRGRQRRLAGAQRHRPRQGSGRRGEARPGRHRLRRRLCDG